jgi:hypothetical protein
LRRTSTPSKQNLAQWLDGNPSNTRATGIALLETALDRYLAERTSEASDLATAAADATDMVQAVLRRAVRRRRLAHDLKASRRSRASVIPITDQELANRLTEILNLLDCLLSRCPKTAPCASSSAMPPIPWVRCSAILSATSTRPPLPTRPCAAPRSDLLRRPHQLGLATFPHPRPIPNLHGRPPRLRIRGVVMVTRDQTPMKTVELPSIMGGSGKQTASLAAGAGEDFSPDYPRACSSACCSTAGASA